MAFRELRACPDPSPGMKTFFSTERKLLIFEALLDRNEQQEMIVYRFFSLGKHPVGSGSKISILLGSGPKNVCPQLPSGIIKKWPRRTEPISESIAPLPSTAGRSSTSWISPKTRSSSRAQLLETPSSTSKLLHLNTNQVFIFRSSSISSHIECCTRKEWKSFILLFFYYLFSIYSREKID